MSDTDAPSGKPQSYTRKTLGDSDDKPALKFTNVVVTLR